MHWIAAAIFSILSFFSQTKAVPIEGDQLNRPSDEVHSAAPINPNTLRPQHSVAAPKDREQGQQIPPTQSMK
jgi:hypothetical protein